MAAKITLTLKTSGGSNFDNSIASKFIFHPSNFGLLDQEKPLKKHEFDIQGSVDTLI